MKYLVITLAAFLAACEVPEPTEPPEIIDVTVEEDAPSVRPGPFDPD